MAELTDAGAGIAVPVAVRLEGRPARAGVDSRPDARPGVGVTDPDLEARPGVGVTDPDLEARLLRLGEVLADHGRVVVAFSGGADSAFLAWTARRALGADAVLAVTAVSPSLAPSELADCRSLAEEWDIRWRGVDTDELARPAYRANGTDRCYHCKTELMEALLPLADAEQAVIVLGVNLDDLGDHRPGQQAATERGASFPLVDAGFTKADVRAASAAFGLRTWDKPAAACLASRLPYGTPVTFRTLSQVAAAEEALRGLGFSQLRVRHYGDLARIELEPSSLPDAVHKRRAVVEAVKAAGYRYVTLDLEGFRSGNLNHAVGDDNPPGPSRPAG